MYCSGCPEKGRKRAFVTIYREALLYDVRNKAFVIGDTMPEEDSHKKHQVQDIGEKGNIDEATRMFDLYFAKLCNDIYAHTKKNFGCGAERDDILEEKPFYRVELNVPEDFSEPSLTYLTRLIHEYIVDMTLWDWLGTCGLTELSAIWLQKAALLEEEVRSALSGRINRTRNSQTPF